jgi:cytosolic carboxypeptidase protein 2/3
MQNDINTNGHTQWFFYQVKNTRRNLSVTFNIMNYTKPDSLFNYGMKVSIYSEKRAAGVNQEDQVVNEGVGWFKGGERISYYNNGIKKDVNYYSKSYYTASFSHKFTHDDDVVYFAFCIPYTYTDL